VVLAAALFLISAHEGWLSALSFIFQLEEFGQCTHLVSVLIAELAKNHKWTKYFQSNLVHMGELEA
jgi:hypothetical protein